MNSFNTVNRPVAVLFSVQTRASLATDIFLFLCKEHSIISSQHSTMYHTILHIIERHGALPPDGRVRRGAARTGPAQAQAGAEARVLSALSVRGPPKPVPDRLPPPTHVTPIIIIITTSNMVHHHYGHWTLSP